MPYFKTPLTHSAIGGKVFELTNGPRLRFQRKSAPARNAAASIVMANFVRLYVSMGWRFLPVFESSNISPMRIFHAAVPGRGSCSGNGSRRCRGSCRLTHTPGRSGFPAASFPECACVNFQQRFCMTVYCISWFPMKRRILRRNM